MTLSELHAELARILSENPDADDTFVEVLIDNRVGGVVRKLRFEDGFVILDA